MAGTHPGGTAQCSLGPMPGQPHGDWLCKDPPEDACCRRFSKAYRWGTKRSAVPLGSDAIPLARFHSRQKGHTSRALLDAARGGARRRACERNRSTEKLSFTLLCVTWQCFSWARLLTEHAPHLAHQCQPPPFTIVRRPVIENHCFVSKTHTDETDTPHCTRGTLLVRGSHTACNSHYRADDGASHAAPSQPLA